MSNGIYATLTRQHGLMREMQVVANNLANASTTGYKSDRAIFAEFLVETGPGHPSVSMGGLGGHAFKLEQGALRFTNAPLDLAIEGEGFFVVQTAQGERLTRAGHFSLSPDGTLVDPMGNAVLNAGGNPIQLPDEAGAVTIGSDGSVSVGGNLVDSLGIVTPAGQLQRETNTMFVAEGGFQPAAQARVVQGALEQSNVSPVLEVARMIEVQRAYEAGQSVLDREDDRISQLISTVRER